MSDSTEIWKAIEEYEGFYEVSNFGRVRSLDREIVFCRNGKEIIRRLKGVVLKDSSDDNNYIGVSLYKDAVGKSYTIHRLVAQAFIPNSDNKPEVNHKDGDKTNNHYLNLEWCTEQENIQHAFKTGLNIIRTGKKNRRLEFGIEVLNKKGEVVTVLYGKKDIVDFGLNYGNVYVALKRGGMVGGFTFRKIPLGSYTQMTFDFYSPDRK